MYIFNVYLMYIYTKLSNVFVLLVQVGNNLDQRSSHIMERYVTCFLERVKSQMLHRNQS